MSEPFTYPAGPQATPYVVLNTEDDQLEIHWPDPRPFSFLISSDLFHSLIDEINTYRAKRL